jgi:hypothetical protein
MITSKEYRDWCDAVSNSNRAALEIKHKREENYKWMGNLLRKWFEQFGEVVNVHINRDASEITVRMCAEIDLDAKLFSSLPFQFTLKEHLGDLVFVLKPAVWSEEDS